METDYQEYVTAPSIAAKWHDMTAVGTCGICQGDDSPIVIDTDPDYRFPKKCKWCAEFSNITYHLKNNGTRRLEKPRKTYTSLSNEFQFKIACVFTVLYLVIIIYRSASGK